MKTILQAAASLIALFTAIDSGLVPRGSDYNFARIAFDSLARTEQFRDFHSDAGGVFH